MGISIFKVTTRMQCTWVIFCQHISIKSRRKVGLFFSICAVQSLCCKQFNRNHNSIRVRCCTFFSTPRKNKLKHLSFAWELLFAIQAISSLLFLAVYGHAHILMRQTMPKQVTPPMILNSLIQIACMRSFNLI